MTAPPHRGHASAIAASILLAAEMIVAIVLPRGAVAAVRYVGAACGIAALPLIYLPMFTLRRYGKTPEGTDYMRTTQVVERGAFAVVRHPQYTGYLLLAATFAGISQHPATIGLALAGAIAVVRWTLSEERDLRVRFGEGYADYMRRVPRFNLPAGILRRLRKLQ